MDGELSDNVELLVIAGFESTVAKEVDDMKPTEDEDVLEVFCRRRVESVPQDLVAALERGDESVFPLIKVRLGLAEFAREILDTPPRRDSLREWLINVVYSVQCRVYGVNSK